jgi:hypothetical protein
VRLRPLVLVTRAVVGIVRSGGVERGVEECGFSQLMAKYIVWEDNLVPFSGEGFRMKP